MKLDILYCFLIFGLGVIVRDFEHVFYNLHRCILKNIFYRSAYNIEM